MLNEPEVGQRFVTALREADLAGIGDCFSPDVGFTALLPRGMVEASGRDAVAALLTGWLDPGRGFTVVQADAGAVGHRLHLSYQVRLHAADGPLLMEQHAFCDVSDDGISSVRLVCSGRVPE